MPDNPVARVLGVDTGYTTPDEISRFDGIATGNIRGNINPNWQRRRRITGQLPSIAQVLNVPSMADSNLNDENLSMENLEELNKKRKKGDSFINKFAHSKRDKEALISGPSYVTINGKRVSTRIRKKNQNK